jgi:hypothetical protein
MPMKMQWIESSETLALKAPDAERLPKNHNTAFNTQRKFEIKITQDASLNSFTFQIF